VSSAGVSQCATGSTLLSGRPSAGCASVQQQSLPGKISLVSSALHDLALLSARLGLANEQQDWGIINADASRLDEFIRIYTTDPLSSYQRYAMAALVLASANELLCADPQADLGLVPALLPTISADAQPEIDYWRTLVSDNEFPLGTWLRQRT
jgi:hypothetical protein